MQSLRSGILFLLVLGPASLAIAAEPTSSSNAKESLQAFNDLIGAWRGTGVPDGSREEKAKQGFWIENVAWQWQFKGKDAWLAVEFKNGKHFTRGALRPLAEAGSFQFRLQDKSDEERIFEGKLKKNVLTVDRIDRPKKETQRLVVTLLHENRFLYRYEVKRDDRPLFSRVYQVGAVKDGVPFAGPGDAKPECIVSGGLGTIAVMHKGQTYYVCCGGCRDAFKDDPDKFIQEQKEKKTKTK